MRVLAVTTLTVLVGLIAPHAAPAFGPLGEDFRISFMGADGDTNYEAGEPSVAYNPSANEYLVVWSGDDNAAPLVNDESEILAQRVSASGALLGGRIRVSDMGPDGDANYEAFSPQVAYNPANDQYLVTWFGDDNNAPLVDDEFEIFGQLLGATGGAVGVNDFRISDMGPDGDVNYDADSPSVAYNSADSLWLVTWSGDDNTAPLVDEEREAFGQLLTAAGVGAGVNDFRISDMGPDGDASYDVFAPSVSYSSADSQFLVVWEGEDNTAPLVQNESEIFGQRLTNFGVEGGANDFRISDMGPDPDTSYGAFNPSVAYGSADNQFLVTWRGDDDTGPLVDNEYEVYGQLLDRTGAAVGTNDSRISDMGPDGDGNYGAGSPSVAYSSADNQYLVTWSGDDNTAPLVTDEIEVFGQLLGNAGVERGANDFRVSDAGPDGSVEYGAFNPSVAYSSARNEYLVTWQGDDDEAPLVDNEFEVFGQRLGEPAPPDGGAAPDSGGTPGAGGPLAEATPDRLAPRFLRLALSPVAFAAFSSGPSVRNSSARGTRVTYRLSEAATATFRVQRVVAGRRVRGRCVRPTRANRGRPRCKRYRTLRGGFRHTGTAGLNRFRFSGRLRGRKLRPGRYRLVATARDAAGNRSKPARRLFRMIR